MEKTTKKLKINQFQRTIQHQGGGERVMRAMVKVLARHAKAKIYTFAVKGFKADKEMIQIGDEVDRQINLRTTVHK